MKSFAAKQGEVERRWYVADAEGKPLGRLAVKIASVLRGKHRPTFTPYVDTGDFVVVINAEKVKLSGKKEQQKVYRRYSGYRGGLREIKASDMRARHPERMVELAVRRMLPKNKLSRRAFSRLKVYAGGTHPHAAQGPEPMALE